MSQNISDNQHISSILRRRPFFCVVFIIGLSLAIYTSAQQFLGSMLGLSHTIQPRGPFPDVSKYDLATIIEALKIVLRFIYEGGSIYDQNYTSTSWPASFTRSGLILIVSSVCMLSILFARGRMVALPILIGGLLISGMALYFVGAALFMGHGGSDALALLFPVAVVYIAIGIYGLIVATKEARYGSNCGLSPIKYVVQP